MLGTEIYFDKNFIIVVCLTIVLVASCLVYLKALSTMLKNKYWKVAMGIFIVLFVFTLVQIIMDLTLDIPINDRPYIRLLIFKVIVVAHGIYFLSVELGHSQGVRKTTASLNDNEILLVLLTTSLSSIMINLHTLNWNFERGLIVLLFNCLFGYLVVNIVFYLGEIKYYFIYSIPMLITFVGMWILSGEFSEDKRAAFLQTQVGIILTLVYSAVYLFMKMQYEIVESRSVIRKIDLIDVEELGLE